MNSAAELQQPFREARDAVLGAKRIAILTHLRADGDAIGSIVALQNILRLEGRRATAMLFEPPSHRYAFLAQAEPPALFDDAAAQAALADADLWIVADTAARLQVLPFVARLDRRATRLLVIDHHRTRDIVGDVEVIDESASATALIVAEWCAANGWPLSRPAADALFVGLATDTGWFRHAGADARTYRAAAELIARGARPDELYGRLYLSEPLQRFRLFAAVAGRMELECAGRLAVQQVTPGLMNECGASAGMTEDLVNEPLRIETIRASILLTETDGGEIRASLRGKEGVDVGRIAERYGGGGHRLAAGCKLPGPLAAARGALVAAMGEALGSASG